MGNIIYFTGQRLVAALQLCRRLDGFGGQLCEFSIHLDVIDYEEN